MRRVNERPAGRKRKCAAATRKAQRWLWHLTQICRFGTMHTTFAWLPRCLIVLQEVRAFISLAIISLFNILSHLLVHVSVILWTGFSNKRNIKAQQCMDRKTFTGISFTFIPCLPSSTCTFQEQLFYPEMLHIFVRLLLELLLHCLPWAAKTSGWLTRFSTLHLHFVLMTTLPGTLGWKISPIFCPLL